MLNILHMIMAWGHCIITIIYSGWLKSIASTVIIHIIEVSSLYVGMSRIYNYNNYESSQLK